jgi:hypothetical protein
VIVGIVAAVVVALAVGSGVVYLFVRDDGGDSTASGQRSSTESSTITSSSSSTAPDLALPTLPSTTVAPPPPPTPRFGAFAVSRTTADIGYSINTADQQSANSQAMTQCRASSCELVLSFSNACGAVAQSPVNLYWGWASAPSRQTAIDVAIKSVRGADPKLLVVQCTENSSP